MRSARLEFSRGARAAIALGASSALCGCALGPDFRPPEPPAVASYTAAPQPAETGAASGPGGNAQHFVEADAIGGAWWRMFGSPALDKLVQQALDDSPTLAQARMKLVQAQQDYLAQAGATEWPQVDASLNATREKSDPAAFGIGSLAGGRSFPPFTLYSAKVSVSYTLDLFGANRRALEALAAQIDYQQFELDAARLSLAGNVVTATVRRASLAKQIVLTQELLTEQSRQLDITDERYRAGGVSRMDLLSQRSQVEQTRASLAPLRTQLAQADHQLAVYLGRAPGQLASGGERDTGALDLDALVLPAELPLTLPSSLARQRPDIRASEALLHQASANVGAGLTQPLFHGGQLQARKRSAEAAYEAALAAYRQTVLQGLQQVADALRALQQDAIELESRDEAQRDARASAEIASLRYAAGGLSQLALLDTQRQQLQTTLDRAKVQAQRLADTAALYQALGARP